MYTLKEIKAIIQNCNTMIELIEVCKTFKKLEPEGQCIKHVRNLSLLRVLQL